MQVKNTVIEHIIEATTVIRETRKVKKNRIRKESTYSSGIPSISTLKPPEDFLLKPLSLLTSASVGVEVLLFNEGYCSTNALKLVNTLPMRSMNPAEASLTSSVTGIGYF